jgi:hypothetical protein
MKKEHVEKAKSEMRLIERIMAEIPGFRGYKQKELRRETDRLLRNYLYEKLSKAKDGLRVVFQEVVNKKIVEVWNDMDRLMARIDKVSEEINHASYGYSGFFDVVKIEEEDLDYMVEFDSKLVENVREIGTRVQKFEDDVMAGKVKNIRAHMDGVREALEHLESVFDERKNVIAGVKVN